MKKVVFLTCIFIFSLSTIALPLDAKFIARLLGLSDSKKTVLINKGRENGLKMGNHAKISLPSGMIARAVVVKLAPSRSVWSIYRFFHKDKLIPQTAVSFKISSPVKLTSDESRSLGLFADKVTKKEKALPPEGEQEKFEKKQKGLRQEIIKAQKTIGTWSPVDYSSLDDEGVPSELNKDIDWSGLEGEKDSEYFNATLDYSLLK